MKFSRNWSQDKIHKTMQQKKSRFWSNPSAWDRANDRISGFCHARDIRCFAEVGKRVQEVYQELEESKKECSFPTS